MSEGSNSMKFLIVGLVVSLFLVITGVELSVDVMQKVKGDGMNEAIIGLQIALKEKTNELKRILFQIEDQLSKDKKDLLKLNMYLERALADEETINNLTNNIKSQFNLEKKIATAHVFFQHTVKLILILSGIIGLFWVAIWTAREQREKRETEHKESPAG